MSLLIRKNNLIIEFSLYSRISRSFHGQKDQRIRLILLLALCLV
jgi:hypothetical protein